MDSAPGPLVRAEEPRYVTWLKVFWVFFFLFVFLVGIGGMGKSFKLMGGSWMEDLLQQSRGPFCSLMIGILGTTLVQSSSMTTSVLVGMV
ncbi:MAG: hypothetical protein ACYST0_11970, partial [Planctomycetota bacterium]